MNTFLNIQLEKSCDNNFLNRLEMPLHFKINLRGSHEQFYALFSTHDKNIVKRLCKQTYSRGAEFFSKYSL